MHWTPRLIGAFAYTTLVPGRDGHLGLVLAGGADRRGQASTFHFLNPFFGVAVAAALLGERLGPTDVAGVVIIAVGILAVQMSKARPS